MIWFVGISLHGQDEECCFVVAPTQWDAEDLSRASYRDHGRRCSCPNCDGVEYHVRAASYDQVPSDETEDASYSPLNAAGRTFQQVWDACAPPGEMWLGMLLQEQSDATMTSLFDAVPA
jgi:hypothetical protein